MTSAERYKADTMTDGKEKDGKQVDLSRALLTSVATTNISTLQQGLAIQITYWSGIAWIANALAQIASALAQRIECIQDVDLVGVTEKLASFVSFPDAGLVGRSHEEESVSTIAGDGNGLTPSMADRPIFDFSGSKSLALAE